MYEWQRMDWKRMREMHCDEDNVDEWEWKWKEREMQNGLEKRQREMQCDEELVLKGRMEMECVKDGEWISGMEERYTTIMLGL